MKTIIILSLLLAATSLTAAADGKVQHFSDEEIKAAQDYRDRVREELDANIAAKERFEQSYKLHVAAKAVFTDVQAKYHAYTDAQMNRLPADAQSEWREARGTAQNAEREYEAAKSAQAAALASRERLESDLKLAEDTLKQMLSQNEQHQKDVEFDKPIDRIIEEGQSGERPPVQRAD